MSRYPRSASVGAFIYFSSIHFKSNLSQKGKSGHARRGFRTSAISEMELFTAIIKG